MNTITLHGTIAADGVLLLPDLPALPAGPVRVTIEPLAGRPQRRGLMDTIASIRAAQDARGYKPPTPEEWQRREAALVEEEEDYERRMDEARSGIAEPPS